MFAEPDPEATASVIKWPPRAGAVITNYGLIKNICKKIKKSVLHQKYLFWLRLGGAANPNRASGPTLDSFITYLDNHLFDKRDSSMK